MYEKLAETKSMFERKDHPRVKQENRVKEINHDGNSLIANGQPNHELIQGEK